MVKITFWFYLAVFVLKKLVENFHHIKNSWLQVNFNVHKLCQYINHLGYERTKLKIANQTPNYNWSYVEYHFWVNLCDS